MDCHLTHEVFNKDSIHKLSDKHRSQIIFLDQTLEDQRWSGKVWKETWEDFGYFFLQTTCLEGDVIAFGLWTFPPTEDVMHLLKIVVQNLHRGAGLAAKLFEQMLEAYPQKGVYLEVKSSNTVAVGFYQKQGLRIMTKTRNYYGPGQDAYKMFKAALPNA